METVIEYILTGSFMVVALLMTFLILLQEGKGGGLSALGGTKAASVEGVTNPIRRATAWLAGIWFALAIALGMLHGSGKGLSAPGKLYQAQPSAEKKADAGAEDQEEQPAIQLGGADGKIGEVQVPVTPDPKAAAPAGEAKAPDAAAKAAGVPDAAAKKAGDDAAVKGAQEEGKDAQKGAADAAPKTPVVEEGKVKKEAGVVKDEKAAPAPPVAVEKK